MASAVSRVLRLAGGAWLVALAIGLIRALRPRHKTPAAASDSQFPPAERPEPAPRQGPVRFKDQSHGEAGSTQRTADAAPQADAEPAESAAATGATTSAAEQASGAQRWRTPVGGECPDGYPLKAAAGSRIFHAPGGAFYERTVPERCYATAAAAEADGLRAAKR